MSEQFGKTGIYMRLSRDDDKAGESMSIENQRIILTEYVIGRGGKIVDEYIDDGWSGTNFDRPEVKRLLSDAQSGIIDTIVVKDLSRFGRNYIQVGQYVDYIFPAYGIRFIAINDNVDTFDRCSTAMDMMPIMNVFNEWHAANTSKKIRAVLEANRRSGKCTSWSYPYGYKAGTDLNRTAVIDEEAAEVVKRIFRLRAEGNSSGAIARILTDEGIPNPATYYTKLDGSKWNRPCASYWCPSTVSEILSNATYTGSLIQNKTTSVSYKNHKKIKIPVSERIIKKNAHEAIICSELWEKVQNVNNSASRGKADKSNKVHALSGLLICADCGKKLKLKTRKQTKNPQEQKCSFICRTYADIGKKYCTAHSISEKEIEGLILTDIRSMLCSAELDEEKLKESFSKALLRRSEKKTDSDETRLKANKSRLSELDKLIKSAFEEMVLKNLPESVFKSLLENYQKEYETVSATITTIERKLAESKECEESTESQTEQTAEEYVAKLKSYINCESLTREMCLQLIQFITVGEQNGVGTREIHIYYRFSKS